MREKGAGFSLVELLVILGIVGILVAIAVPTTNRSMLNLSYSMGEFESNVRVARGNATGVGYIIASRSIRIITRLTVYTSAGARGSTTRRFPCRRSPFHLMSLLRPEPGKVLSSIPVDCCNRSQSARRRYK